MARTLLVDTIPKDARNQGTVNLGLEIAAKRLNADVCFWWDFVEDKEAYDTIAFNVFYPTHLLNVWPFLHNNRIEPLWANRLGSGPRLIAGGQGCGRRDILGNIVDSTLYGEVDGDHVDVQGAWRASELTSRPCVKGNKAVIELTRGCKYRCKFCEYGWVHGGKYREKPFDLVREQIDRCLSYGVRRINLMTVNLGGYSRVEELLDYCQRRGVNIANTDTCLRDLSAVGSMLDRAYVRVGLESFDEATRASIGKPMSDEALAETVETLLGRCSAVHFYLIYGLPGDDYERWFHWLERLQERRLIHSQHRPIRYELSITNFEPCVGTPLADAPLVDFEEKHRFLRKWGAELIRLGYHQGDHVWYENCGGRFGRKEASYRLLMALKQGGRELTGKMASVYPRGITRSIDDEKAERFFLKGYKPRMPRPGRSGRWALKHPLPWKKIPWRLPVSWGNTSVRVSVTWDNALERVPVFRVPVLRVPVRRHIKLCYSPFVPRIPVNVRIQYLEESPGALMLCSKEPVSEPDGKDDHDQYGNPIPWQVLG